MSPVINFGKQCWDIHFTFSITRQVSTQKCVVIQVYLIADNYIMMHVVSHNHIRSMVSCDTPA